MIPAAMKPHNPFEGLSVEGVRSSFEHSPIKSAAAGALFGASLYWGLKTARHSGPVGAALKGMIALAVMNKAKNMLMSSNGHYARAARY
jgi:hypothetical protein